MRVVVWGGVEGRGEGGGVGMRMKGGVGGEDAGG